MTYIQSRNSRGGNSFRYTTLSVFLIVVAVIGIRFLLPNFFSGFMTAIARPFWRTEFSISSGQLMSAEALLDSKEDLMRRLDEANMRGATAFALAIENTELKSMLGRASSTPIILAAVLSKPPLAPYDSLVLDIGSENGIVAGSMVYGMGNVPLGKITDVLAHSSKVLLFSSPGQRFDVLVGKTHIQAIALGKGGGQYVVELPRDSKVMEGDTVAIPSLKSNLYGIVSSIVSDPSQPFEKVLFAVPLNIFELRWVYVEKP